MASIRSRYAQTSYPRKQKRRGLDYQRCEDRNLLAGVLCESAVALPLLDQLAEREDTAYLQQGLNQLEEVGSETTELGTTTVFQQRWNGLLVNNSYVTILQDADGTITNVRDQAQRNIIGFAADTDPIDQEDAEKIGSSGLGEYASLEYESELAWHFTGNRARLSYLVETTVFDIDGEVAGEFDTWINVFDGEIFDREISGSAVEGLLADATTETGIFPRIVINDAIGAAGSRQFAAAPEFNSVVSISVGCTGSLIAHDTVITARHCGVGAGNTISFGDNSNNPDATFTVASASNPGGGNANSPLLNGGDVTILTLTSSVPASVATPLRFIDATTELVGLTATTVGFGFNGVGSTGHGNSSDGFRWGGENIIDAFGSPASANGSNIISTDFDNGTQAANTIGSSSSTPLEFEATTAPGDSGSPVLVEIDGEFVIAGVLSGGTTANSVFGDISWWTGTAIYRAQIEDAGGTFLGDGAGTVDFAQDAYFVGDTVELQVRDGNVTGDVTVTITSSSGDSEELTVAQNGATTFAFSIESTEGTAAQNDGTLQIQEGDELEVTYTDVDDGDGNTVTRTDSIIINALAPEALIGIDFDGAANSPTNFLTLEGGTDGSSDLTNENGGLSQVDLEVIGGSADFAVTLNTNTIPQHSTSLADLGGQIFTGGDPISFEYSDLSASSEYFVYVFSAEGFFDTIEQTVTLQGAGSPVSFEQRFNQDDLFINDQLGDSSRDLTEYAQVITSDANGVITIDITPIDGTNDVVLAGLAIFKVPEAPDVVDDSATTDENVAITIDVLANDTDADRDAFSVIEVGTANNGVASINADGTVEYTPNGGFIGTDTFTYTVEDEAGNVSTANVSVNVVEDVPTVIVAVNEGETGRSNVNEVVVSFDEIVTFGSGAFELVQRGADGGPVDVTTSIDNSSGRSIVTLTFSGSFATASGSLVDGNYELTVVGDQITTSSGAAYDANDDGVAGGSFVHGDTETDNFFRLFGDGDGDRDVDLFDLLGFRTTFGQSTGNANFNEGFDANGDGVVNVIDLLSFRQNFGERLDF